MKAVALNLMLNFVFSYQKYFHHLALFMKMNMMDDLRMASKINLVDPKVSKIVFCSKQQQL